MDGQCLLLFSSLYFCDGSVQFLSGLQKAQDLDRRRVLLGGMSARVGCNMNLEATDHWFSPLREDQRRLFTQLKMFEQGVGPNLI